MRPSDVAFWMARKQPRVTRWGLHAWAHCGRRFGRRGKSPHWVFVEVSNRLNYRAILRGTLGNGMQIRVPWNDFIGRRILEDGYYEPETVHVIEELLEPGAVFFDIGAHVGQYTLVASRLVGDAGEVHSFEPDPDTYRCLTGNVELNRLTNARTNQLALTNENGPRKLYLASHDGMGCNSMAPPVNFSGRECEVSCTTLDEYVKEKKIAKVDLIKMDVEGAELSVLQGGHALLEGTHPPILILEFEEARQRAFGSSCGKLHDFLHERGYDLYRHVDGAATHYQPSAGDPPTFNVLAVPARKLEHVAGRVPGL